MKEEEAYINEKRGLLQDCLPGVTLQNGHGYYHRRHPSDLSSQHTQAVDQLEQQILISKAMSRKSNDDDTKFSTALSSISTRRGPNITSVDELSTIKILWIDKESHVESYSDDDDLDGTASYSVSIRQAAAVSEAKRRSEERWALYLKWIFIAAFGFLLCDKVKRTRTEKNTAHVQATNANKFKFRFHSYWENKVNSMFFGEQDDRSDKADRKILVALKDLDEAIHGDIVLRSNKTKFQDAARVWQRQNYLVNEAPLTASLSEQVSPLAVVEAKNLNDVQLALPILGGLNRDYGLEFRVRSGGYAYMSGYSTIADGVMLSLAKMNTITIESHENHGSNQDVEGYTTGNQLIENFESDVMKTTNSTVVIMEPGVRAEDFMKEVLDENGFSGIVASAAGVGMGGFVLGGGYGLQSRMYGLAIDNVLSLEVVLPSGEMKKVKEGDDLFWALRGAGGGNIGVVTSIEYEVYPCHDIKLAANVKLSLQEVTKFLELLGNKESNLAHEFTLRVERYATMDAPVTNLTQHPPLTSSMLNTTDGSREEGLVTLSMFWMGDSSPDDPLGMQYIKNEIVPLFPNNSTAERISYYYFSWTGMSREREQNPILRSVWSAQSWNGFLLPSNNTREVWTDIQSSLSAMLMYCNFISPKIELWGGAISKISSNATAFPHRNAVYNIGIDLVVLNEHDADAALDEMHLVNAIWPSIARHLDGAYVNYPMPSLSNVSYPIAYWGENLDRLIKLTQQYDPSRVLKVAQSVPTRIKNYSISVRH